MTTLVVALFALGTGGALYFGGRRFYAYWERLRFGSAVVVAGLVLMSVSLVSCAFGMGFSIANAPDWVLDVFGFLAMGMCPGAALVLFGLIMWAGDPAIHQRKPRQKRENRPDAKPDDR